MSKRPLICDVDKAFNLGEWEPMRDQRQEACPLQRTIWRETRRQCGCFYVLAVGLHQRLGSSLRKCQGSTISCQWDRAICFSFLWRQHNEKFMMKIHLWIVGSRSTTELEINMSEGTQKVMTPSNFSMWENACRNTKIILTGSQESVIDHFSWIIPEEKWFLSNE